MRTEKEIRLEISRELEADTLDREKLKELTKELNEELSKPTWLDERVKEYYDNEMVRIVTSKDFNNG